MNDVPGTAVFKVLRSDEWARFAARGRFEGSPADLADGFVHLSAAGQLLGTLTKHYGDETSLVLVRIRTSVLGDALKWEPSRGGALFPHLYGPLLFAHVDRTARLTRGEEGWRLPPWVEA